MCLMFMRMTIANNIKLALPKIENAKEFMNFVEGCSQTTDKSLAGTLMSSLTTMKYDGSRTMHEHILEITTLTTQLKTLGMTIRAFSDEL